ncbi:MAG: hypothetical protein WAL46_01515 [Nitrososphaeraceae archaeon]
MKKWYRWIFLSPVDSLIRIKIADEFMSSAPEPVISNTPGNGPDPTTDNVNCAFVFIPFPKSIVDFCI